MYFGSDVSYTHYIRKKKTQIIIVKMRLLSIKQLRKSLLKFKILEFYSFIFSIIPYKMIDWLKKLSIFACFRSVIILTKGIEEESKRNWFILDFYEFFDTL